VAPSIVMVLENTGESSDAQPAKVDDASKAEEEDVGSGPATVISAEKGEPLSLCRARLWAQQTQNREYYKLFGLNLLNLRAEIS
jgi:hypothetical protein